MYGNDYYEEQVDEGNDDVVSVSENVKNRLVKFEFQYIEDPSPS